MPPSFEARRISDMLLGGFCVIVGKVKESEMEIALTFFLLFLCVLFIETCPTTFFLFFLGLELLFRKVKRWIM